jgi:hypothetical protein
MIRTQRPPRTNLVVHNGISASDFHQKLDLGMEGWISGKRRLLCTDLMACHFGYMHPDLPFDFYHALSGLCRRDLEIYEDRFGVRRLTI